MIVLRFGFQMIKYTMERVAHHKMSMKNLVYTGFVYVLPCALRLRFISPLKRPLVFVKVGSCAVTLLDQFIPISPLVSKCILLHILYLVWQDGGRRYRKSLQGQNVFCPVSLMGAARPS